MLDKMMKVLGVTTDSTVTQERPYCDSYSPCLFGTTVICINGECEYSGDCC